MSNNAVIGIVMLFGCCAGLSAASSELDEARTSGADGKVTFHVVNSRGEDVVDASVKAGFYNPRKGDDVCIGQTDSNGLFAATGNSVDDMNYSIIKDGFYITTGRYVFYRRDEISVLNGRWQPWNPTNVVVLKERRNPIPMYAKRVDVLLPERDKPIGFDLELGDWVKPHGIGSKSDLIIMYKGSYGDIQVFSKELRLGCGNEQSGLQVLTLDSSSDLQSVYSAPEEGYARELVWERERTKFEIKKSKELDKDEYVVFRTRVVTNEKGELVGAHYGKIYGPIRYGRMGESHRLMFNYYFNPVENDRNIEFDPIRNLFPDTPFDRVTMP